MLTSMADKHDLLRRWESLATLYAYDWPISAGHARAIEAALGGAFDAPESDQQRDGTYHFRRSKFFQARLWDELVEVRRRTLGSGLQEDRDLMPSRGGLSRREVRHITWLAKKPTE